MERQARAAFREGGIAVRRLIALAFLVGGGCAQPGAPPGGPPDSTPPNIVRIRPDSDSRNVREGNVSFVFDEVVGERPQGATTLSGLFLISPSSGDPTVSWKRTRLDVRPRGGFRPNITYTVTMLPGLMDLDGNVDSVGRTIVFSTGATIAASYITGTAFDWVGNRAATNALVEAISLPDSAYYRAATDSLGTFRVGHLPRGKYLLRATVDQNKNRRVDLREAFDTVTVTLADSVRHELYAFMHDTLGPQISGIAVADSMSLRVTFDHALDTALVLTPALFQLKAADSSVVAITSVMTTRALERQRADSLRTKHAQDSIKAAAVADSARRADSARVNAQIQRPANRRPTADSGRGLPADTSRREPPRPRIAVPSTDVIVTTARPLPAASLFRLRAEKMRSLLGIERSSERVVRTPKEQPTDSTKGKLPADTGAKKVPIDTVLRRSPRT
jgi:hypothetical protein